MVSDPAIRAFVDDIAECARETTEQEVNVFGMDHCHVGKTICEKWGFSPALQTAILRHHTPHLDPLCEAGAFIMLGHFLAMRDFPDEQLVAFFPDEINEQLGLSAEIILRAREMFFANDEE
jgi:HD-like signal output (HDOD) protein